jgi:hypothetical protein
MYSLYGSVFAEKHISFPFLNFPIFIGEICLFLLLCTLFIKSMILKVKSNYFHFWVALFIIFIVLKAFYGYFKWGPLAFRNAAMFYYLLFAVVSFYSFNKKIFNQIFVLIFLFLLFITIWFSGKIGNYSGFTYCSLILITAIAISNRFTENWIAKTLVFLICLYFFRLVLQGSSSKGFFFSCWAGFLFIIFSFVHLFLSKYKLKKNQLFLFLFSIAILILSFILGIDQGMKVRLKFWANFSNIKQEYKQHIVMIAAYDSIEDIPYRGEKFDYLLPQYGKIKLYEEESLTKKTTSRNNKNKMKKKSLDKFLNRINQKIRILMRNIENNKPKEERLKKELRFITNNTYIIENGLKKLATNRISQSQQTINDIKTETKVEIHSIKDKSSTTLFTDTQKEKVENISLKDVAAIEELPILFEKMQNIYSKSELHKNRKIEKGFKLPQSDVSSTLWRLFVWRDIFKEMVAERAFLGVDFGKPLRSQTMEKLRYLTGATWSLGNGLGWIEPHNSYIHIIYRSGIIGIFFIATILFLFIKTFFRFVRKKSYIGIILSSAIFCYLMLSNFVVFLELPRLAIPFWCLFGITYAYSKEV